MVRFHRKPLLSGNVETVHDCEVSHPPVTFHHIALRNRWLVLTVKGERKKEKSVVWKPFMGIEMNDKSKLIA